jgi:hypothetical protein
MKSVCVALVVLLAVNGSLAFWTSCPSGAAPTAVSSPVCTSTVCTVSRGGTLTGEATFRATAAHTALQSTFHAVVFGLETDLTGSDPDAARVCEQLQGVTCSPSNPLTAGSSYTWNLRFSVPTNTPVLSNTQVRSKFSFETFVFRMFDGNFNLFMKQFVFAMELVLLHALKSWPTLPLNLLKICLIILQMT